MGTKNNPGEFDFYAAALPDEPMFVLLARDPQFYSLVNRWAQTRSSEIYCGLRPVEDARAVAEAENCAVQGARWRRENNGIWRKSNT